MQYLIMTKKMNNLQLSQKDMEKEIAQLEDFIKSDVDARELKRAIAVRMQGCFILRRGQLHHPPRPVA